MNSKQRFQMSVEHGKPDRVPIDIGLAPELCIAMEKYIGLTGADFWDWVGQDTELISPGYKNAASPFGYADPTIQVTPDGEYLDIYRVPFRAVKTEFQTYMELAGKPPLASCESAADIERFSFPSADDWDYSNISSDLAKNAHKATWGHSRGFFEISHFMRGMDRFLMDLILEPKIACALMDRIFEYLYARTRRLLEAGTGRFVFFEYNDDIASQNSTFISPNMWRKFIKPRMATMCELIHDYGTLVRYHSCGSVRAIIPDLIEIGVDILNPVQPMAEGMDPFELKQLFGNHLTLHGGIDIQRFLPRATSDEVRQHTRRVVCELGDGGGYILAGSHSLQADIPLDNIVAMLEEAKK